MQALVLFESTFGATREIARAIGNGLFRVMDVDVDVVEVSQAATVLGADVDLLVVGAPGHAFWLSDGTLVGMREWLDELGPAAEGTCAAAFDTRIGNRQHPRSAARTMHRRLSELGFAMVAPPQSFSVSRTAAPL